MAGGLISNKFDCQYPKQVPREWSLSKKRMIFVLSGMQCVEGAVSVFCWATPISRLPAPSRCSCSLTSKCGAGTTDDRYGIVYAREHSFCGKCI